MTYPLFAGEPTEDEEPRVIGGDIEFLLDTPAGFAVATVGEITETVESDLYDDMPGTIDESKIYMLARNMPPRQVFVSHHLVKSDCATESGVRYHQKTVRLVDIDGGVVAEAPYRVYPQELRAS